MTNSKGVSMVSLVITIIVIIILASIAIVVSDNGIDMAYDAKFENERKELKQAVASRFASYMRNSDMYPLEGISVPAMFNDGLSTDEKQQQVLEEVVTYLNSLGRTTVDKDEVKNEIVQLLQENKNHIKYTRIVGATEMLALGLTNISGNINYEYIVNYYSADVIGPIY